MIITNQVSGCVLITLQCSAFSSCVIFLLFITILYRANNRESRHILSGLSLNYASELSGAAPEMATLRVKCRQMSKIVCKSPQIFPKPRIRFYLTRVTPLWYNIQGGKGDNFIFALAGRRVTIENILSFCTGARVHSKTIT